ncbi:MAG: 3-phosphoshikimate 1-carboxyvinyltransferase [bacterium]|nr:3-phosphoshikimate 1-carboxyvinyltransferase [bacterium]
MNSDVIAKPLSSPLSGEIFIPPDKSISHRGIIIGSLTGGKVKISNFSKGGDCVSTLNIFKNLGLEVEIIDDKNLVINSKNGLKESINPLDCGNSGTSMRLLSGYLSGQKFNSVLFGDESLSKRPMKRVIEPLELMGAKIESNANKAPLKITGSKLRGIAYSSKIASAQVKSSILLAGFHASGETTVFEPSLSRDHTEKMFKYFEADIKTGKNENGFYSSIRNSFLIPKDLFIPGDISSAAFFMVAAAIVEGSDVIIRNVGLNETRTGIIDVMKQMNADIEILDLRIVNNEEIGDIRVKYSPDLKGIEIKGDIIPRLIDEIPVICVLAANAKGTVVIKDASDLKNKESDRIKCVADELLKMGADVIPTGDGFIIEGGKKLNGGSELNCYHDHRLAMSFYVASLASKKESLIKDFHWVNTSFPEFLNLFNKLGA